MHKNLDEHEDDSTEGSGDDWSHAQTCEDSSKTLSIVPAPLDLRSTNSSNTDASDGRDKGVGGGDVGGVLCAPHDPGGGSGKGTGESEHLNTGVILEGAVGNDAVLDSIGGTSTDSDCSKELEDSTENHSLAVGDGARGNTSSPGVGNIVFQGLVVDMIHG